VPGRILCTRNLPGVARDALRDVTKSIAHRVRRRIHFFCQAPEAFW